MIARVLKTIKKYNLIENGDKIIIGVSGGPDSVCLLHVLNSLLRELNISIFVVHINHLLRGKESEQDEQYVRNLCEKTGIPLFVSRHDIKEISRDKGISLEEAGREIRYERFEFYAGELGAARIAVAHNKNDQAETVLMNLLRGTGLDGLTGMDYKTGKIIRPLLDIDRADIEDYCMKNLLFPRTDSSNLESLYTRNRVRLELIPFIDRLFELDTVESINRMSRLVRDDYDYIEESVTWIYKQCVVDTGKACVCLGLNRLKVIHPAMQKRVLRRALKQVKGDLKGIESVHVQNALDLFHEGKTGSVIHFPHNIRILKSYDIVKIFIEDSCAYQPVFFDMPLEIPGVTYINNQHSMIRTDLQKTSINIEDCRNIGYNSLVQFFDYEALGAGISVRTRRKGDVFKPNRSNGTKKLKEYYIDNKIERSIRDAIPLIAKGNEIVWIIGYKISDKFKVTENTKSVLKIEYRPFVRKEEPGNIRQE